MLKFIRGRTTPRKLRLYCVACFRSIASPVRDGRGFRAIELAERHADGQAPFEQLEAAVATALQWKDLIERQDFEAIAYTRYACECARPDLWGTMPAGPADLLRCIFGNPFRPLSTQDASLLRKDGLVVKHAQHAYEDRLPEGMLDNKSLTVLADALDEAEPGPQDLLAHLRDPNGTHFRGCWAVDQVLGKT